MDRSISIVRLRSKSGPKHWLGSFAVVDECGNVVFRCLSMEREGVEVAPGKYQVVLEWSPKFKRYLYELKGVTGRSEIKIHVLTYYTQSDGCIGIGMGTADLNADGIPDLLSSRYALDKFHEAMSGITDSFITITEQ